MKRPQDRISACPGAQALDTRRENLPGIAVGTADSFQRVRVSEELHLVEVGVNYHFNPVLAVSAKILISPAITIDEAPALSGAFSVAAVFGVRVSDCWPGRVHGGVLPDVVKSEG